MNDRLPATIGHNGSADDFTYLTNGNGHRSRRPASAGILRSVLCALFRFRRRAIAFFVVSMTLVAVGLAVFPREYRSEAKLMVRVGRSSVTLDPTVTTGQVMGLEASRETEINSALEIINSRSILEQVVDEVGPGAPYKTPYDRDKAIDKLRKDFTIWSPKLSNVIVATYEADSPAKAQKTVNTLIEAFHREHLRVNSTAGSYEFFEQQRAAIKTQLDEAVARLRDAKNDFSLASVEGRRATLERQIGDVEKQIIDNESQFESTQARIAALESGLGGLPAPVIKQFVQGLPDNAASDMRRQLYELQTQELELLSKYTANHPQVIAIRQQVLEAETILAGEQPDRGQATSAALLTESAASRALSAGRSSLGAHYGRLLEELKALNRQEVDIAELTRSVALLETDYRTYSENLEQARIDQALKRDEITNISTIQPASFSHVPSSPKVGLTLALALVAALFGAIAVALLSDRLDLSLRSSSDVEQRLALPLLVSIPRLSRQSVLPSPAE